MAEEMLETGTVAGPAGLLSSLFAEFDRTPVRYLVLRNYEGYPDEITGDVDVVISPRDGELVQRIFREVVKVSGWAIARETSHSFLLAYSLVNPAAVPSGRPFLAFDFFLGLTWKGLPYLDFEDAWRARVRHRFFWVVNRSTEGWVTVLHHLLYNNEVPDRYHERLMGIFQARVALADPPLSLIDRPLRMAVGRCLRQGRWSELRSYAGGLKRSLVRNNLVEIPLATLRGMCYLLAGYGRSALGYRLPLLLIMQNASGGLESLKQLAEGIYEVFKRFHLAGGRFALISLDGPSRRDRVLHIVLGLIAGGVAYTARPLATQPWILREAVDRRRCLVCIADAEDNGPPTIPSMPIGTGRMNAAVTPPGNGKRIVAETVVRIALRELLFLKQDSAATAV